MCTITSSTLDTVKVQKGASCIIKNVEDPKKEG